MKNGVIRAARHVHMSPSDANFYGVKHLDTVTLKVTAKACATRFDDLLVRVDPAFKLEVHMDTDEATDTASDAVICDMPHWGSSGQPCGNLSTYPNQMGYRRPAHHAVTRTGVSSRTSPVWTTALPATIAASSSQNTSDAAGVPDRTGVNTANSAPGGELTSVLAT